ncbi:unnamed protein product, partial [Vitis vinifera]
MTGETSGFSGQHFCNNPDNAVSSGQLAADRNAHDICAQTGEEFSAEFLRDRVAPRRASAMIDTDQRQPKGWCKGFNENHQMVYEPLNGILGLRRGDSECSSDILDFSPQPHHCQGSGVSDASFSDKMKFLCSFGGRILPRPNDGKLRYVGGETKIISIRKNLSWVELVKKTSAICNQLHTIKYQLPGEDLDALISVSSDEDLHHMIEEYHELERIEGSQRLRIFLVPVGEPESPSSFETRATQQNEADYQYVVAVNGMLDPSPRKNSSGQSVSSQTGNTCDYRDPPFFHPLEMKDGASSSNLVGMFTNPAAQFLTSLQIPTKSFQQSPPVSPLPVQNRDPQNSAMHFFEDHAYHDGHESASQFVTDQWPCDNAYCVDSPSYYHNNPPVLKERAFHSHPKDPLGLLSGSTNDLVGSHHRMLHKYQEAYQNQPTLIVDDHKGNNGLGQDTWNWEDEIDTQVGQERKHDKVITDLTSQDNSTLPNTKLQNVCYNPNSVPSIHISPLEFQDHGDTTMNSASTLMIPENSADIVREQPHDYSLGASTPKFLVKSQNATKDMQHAMTEVISKSSFENPDKKAPSDNHHNGNTPGAAVIVEDVTDILPPGIPSSSPLIPQVEDEASDVITSSGEAEAESDIQESEGEEGRDLGESISDAAMAEMEASIYGLQIIKNADLEELKELGSGTFGTVYHGKWRGTDVAIKRIKKSCFAGRSSEQERLTKDFWREARILSNLHHPNVVAFYGVVPDGPGGTLATVTEYMVNGSLRHVLLRKDRSLDRRKRLIIAMDAAFGMEYLHLKNIVHFDLKCDNLLVNMRDTQRPICKVGDFGLSRIKRNTLVSGGVRGTLPWMAPELLNGSSNRVSEKVDVFSFGVAMWEILTGEEPYANMHCGAIIGGIVSNTLRPPIPERCDPDWRKLMEECWSPDPAARPSFTEITNRLRVMSMAIQTKRHNQANR